MKVKDMMRKLNNENSSNKSVVKEAKQLNRLMSRGSKNTRIKIRDSISRRDSSITNRGKSIDHSSHVKRVRNIPKGTALDLNTPSNATTSSFVHPESEMRIRNGSRKKKVINKRKIKTIPKRPLSICQTEGNEARTEENITGHKTVITKPNQEIQLSSGEDSQRDNPIDFRVDPEEAKEPSPEDSAVEEFSITGQREQEIDPEYFDRVKNWICYDYEM